MSQDMRQKTTHLDPREKRPWFSLHFQMASDYSTGRRWVFKGV